MTKTTNSKLYTCAYIFLALPIIIFMLGWMKWFLAIPATAVAVFALYKMCKDTPDSGYKIPTDRGSIEKIVLVGIIVFFWVYLSGIGALSYQNGDHATRNGIFELLVHYKWPVKANSFVYATSAFEDRGLIYYLGYWLPAAVVGKLFGLVAGYLFQLVWAWLGIMLLYLLICEQVREIKVWPMLMFMSFGGLDFIGYMLLALDKTKVWGSNQLEWWSYYYQFSNVTTQLYWVFNQAIPLWIAMMLMLKQKNNRYLVTILGFVFICSALPTIGMVPIMLYLGLSRKYYVKSEELCIKNKSWWKLFAKDTFTPENILGGGITGIITALYYMSNGSGKTFRIAFAPFDNYIQATKMAAMQTEGIIFDIPYGGFNNYNKGMLFVYLMFILLEVGVYYIAIYKYQKNNGLFYVSLAWLLICPLFKVGVWADFCMRASLPALFVLFVLVLDTLKKSAAAKDRVVQISLIIFLCIGAITAFHEVYMSTNMTFTDLWTGKNMMQNALQIDAILPQSNFSGSVDSSIFFRFLAK